MKNILIGLVAIAGIAIIILLLNPIIGGLHDFQTNNTTAAYSVTTNSSETAKNVTLPIALFNGDIQFATAVSNVTTDAPLVTLYTASTKSLQISGLAVSQTHNLTVAYQIGALDDNTNQLANLGPTIFMFVVVGLLLLAIVAAIIGVISRNR